MDYENIGFKAGLEIHQQLEGTKLFCNCPTIIRKDTADFKIKRKLRASAGESGKVDQAALHEQTKNKVFEYRGYEETTCLVETDEEPPHPVNQEAVSIALKVAKMLHMNVVDEVQFMRKTVVDGSNTTGFQRTALVGMNGYVEVDGSKIGVESICLEEEAAQVIQRTKTKDTYNLSRLGIPLLEIATAPDIKNPKQCKQVAKHLGMILRSVKGMKRGIGSIRQDVNVSIKEGARTEIKGFQEVKSIPEVVENEVKRQQELIKNGEEVEKSVRKAEEDGTTTYLRPMPGADRMYPETDIDTITPSNKEIIVPETITEKKNRLHEEYDLNEQLSLNIAKFESKHYKVEDYLKTYSSKAFTTTNLAELFLTIIPRVEKETDKDVNPSNIEYILQKLSSGTIPSGKAEDVIKEFAVKGDVDFSKFEAISDEQVREEVKKAIGNDPNAPVGALMGQIMGALKGRAEGSQVMKILQEEKNT